MNEQKALELCVQHHDPRGFEFLVSKYRRLALIHAYGFLGNHEDAADACQESFTKAFAALPRMKKIDNFYRWFYRILKNCCLNMIQRQHTVRDYLAGELKEQNKSASESVILQKLEEAEQNDLIWSVLFALKAEHREILLFKYIQCLSYDEIMRQLGIPRGTVMSRLFHARKAFREKYESNASNQRKEVNHE